MDDTDGTEIDSIINSSRRRELVAEYSSVSSASASSSSTSLTGNKGKKLTKHRIWMEQNKRQYDATDNDTAPSSGSTSASSSSNSFPPFSLLSSKTRDKTQDSNFFCTATSHLWGDDDLDRIVTAGRISSNSKSRQYAYNYDDTTTVADSISILLNDNKIYTTTSILPPTTGLDSINWSKTNRPTKPWSSMLRNVTTTATNCCSAVPFQPEPKQATSASLGLPKFQNLQVQDIFLDLQKFEEGKHTISSSEGKNEQRKTTDNSTGTGGLVKGDGYMPFPYIDIPPSASERISTFTDDNPHEDMLRRVSSITLSEEEDKEKQQINDSTIVDPAVQRSGDDGSSEDDCPQLPSAMKKKPRSTSTIQRLSHRVLDTADSVASNSHSVTQVVSIQHVDATKVNGPTAGVTITILSVDDSHAGQASTSASIANMGNSANHQKNKGQPTLSCVKEHEESTMGKMTVEMSEPNKSVSKEAIQQPVMAPTADDQMFDSCISAAAKPLLVHVSHDTATTKITTGASLEDGVEVVHTMKEVPVEEWTKSTFLEEQQQHGKQQPHGKQWWRPRSFWRIGDRSMDTVERNRGDDLVDDSSDEISR